ncbi:MAG: hypothetical protein ACK4WH_12830 [Phycisphaerales bacterium]
MRNAMVMWSCVVWAAGAAARNACAQSPLPEPSPPRTAVEPSVKRKVLHLKLKGDLDSLKMVEDAERAVAQARADGVELVLLELNGDRWRGDVVLGLMPVVRPDGVRTVVWLNDALDGRVGSGQAALGLTASACYIGPKTEVVYKPVQDLREQAPANVDWEHVEDQVRGTLWGRLTSPERLRSPLLAAALPWPRQPLWAVLDRAPGLPGARAERIDATAPSAAEAGRSVALTSGSAERGGLRLRLDPALAVSTGVAEAACREVGQVLAQERIIPQPLLRAEVTSGLNEARQRLAKDLATLDRSAELMDKALDEAERWRGMDAAKRKTRVGKDTLASVEDAAKLLGSIESLVGGYPELLRAAPPGTSTVELTPQRLSAAWHNAFQNRKDRIAELRARAVRLIE